MPFMPVAAYLIESLHNILFMLFGVIAFCDVIRRGDHWIEPERRYGHAQPSPRAKWIGGHDRVPIASSVPPCGAACGSWLGSRSEAGRGRP